MRREPGLKSVIDCPSLRSGCKACAAKTQFLAACTEPIGPFILIYRREYGSDSLGRVAQTSVCGVPPRLLDRTAYDARSTDWCCQALMEIHRLKSVLLKPKPASLKSSPWGPPGANQIRSRGTSGPIGRNHRALSLRFVNYGIKLRLAVARYRIRASIVAPCRRVGAPIPARRAPSVDAFPLRLTVCRCLRRR